MKQEKQKPEQKNSAMRFIWQNAKGQRYWFAVAVLCTLLGVSASFLVPQVIRFTVDSVLGNRPMRLPFSLENWFVGRSVTSSLVACAAAILVFALLAASFSFLARFCISAGTEGFARQLRNRLFRHIQRLPFHWHSEVQTGDIIQRCTSDLDVVRNFAANQLLEVVRTAMLVGVALALMLSMDVALTGIATVFIPVVGFYSIIFFSMVGKKFLAADQAEGDLMVAVQENLTGMRVVRAFGRERYEMDKFDRLNTRFTQLWLRLGRTLSVYWSIGDIVTSLQIFLVLLAGVYFAIQGRIGPGEFLVFITYNQTLAWPVRSLGRTLSEMSKTGISAARLQEILEVEEETEEPNALKPDLNQDIRFENVSFCYNEQPVLQGLSFTIPKGTTFGILGSTGSGKSTITYLLTRLYDLPEGGGSIRFGQEDIRAIDRAYLRRNVSVVLQEPFLFSKTIEENIGVAAKGYKPASVRRAASIAAVDDSIQAFSKGYDTLVGERGVTLSGGQKQRVAIARTLMLQPQVMIFDDSMSAVDLETDAKIRAALRDHTKGATVILISHRLNTLMQADTILVLERGRATAIGTHRELISRPGLYKRIYDLQCAQAETCPEGGENTDV